MSIVIAVFVFIFIWYSNSFFTLRRKKEIGLYCMMGLKKGQAALLLFYENLIMGIIALIFGILSGILFSKLFSMILVKLMGFDLNVSLSVSYPSILSTIEVFLIVFVFTSLSVYIMIFKCEIIDLLKSESKGQKMPKSLSVLSIPAFLLIGLGYYKALNYNYNGFKEILIIVFLTVSGTYMLFLFFSVNAAKFMRNRKSLFFKGTNIITYSQFIYRIKNNAILLATIAVLSACTITAVGGAVAVYNNTYSSINKRLPFSYVYEIKDEQLDKDIEKEISNHKENPIQNYLKVEIKKIKGLYPNINKLKDISDDYEESIDTVISISTLKEILKVLDKDINVDLNDKETLLYFYNMYSEDIMRNPKGMTMYLNNGEEDLPFEIKGCIDYPIINNLFSRSNYILNLVVVSDETYKQLRNDENISDSRLINIENPKNSRDTTESIISIMRKSRLYNNNFYGNNAVNISTYYYEYVNSISEAGMTVFLMSFVGIVFIICTGSIIFFKQLSEAYDDKKRYDILRRIGLGKKEIRKTIGDQLSIIFILPLLIGICHSTVAMNILQPMLDVDVWKSTLAVIVVYIGIYYFYYVLSVRMYCGIVEEK